MNKTIYLAGGCFWCTEAIFQRIIGVYEVVPGYIDGFINNPAYREVSLGKTGHTEAISIEYNSNEVSLVELLLIFFNTHDPTTLNKQGNDIGTQYRSGVYYIDLDQYEVIKQVINQLEKESVFNDPIVTEVKEATPFYKAEEDHINYYTQNSDQSYCTYVIDPKIKKLQKYFSKYIDIKK